MFACRLNIMILDVINGYDRDLIDKISKLGFSRVLCEDDGHKIYDPSDKEPFPLSTYAGKESEAAIRKGKADVITDTDRNGFLLNKGLCSKLKENNMFVLFKFSSLINSDNFFGTYKNFLINGKMCNQYSVDCLFVSFSAKEADIKSPTQLAYFARQFGYNYKNFIKAQEDLLKRI